MNRYQWLALALLVLGFALMTLYTVKPLSHPFGLWIGFAWGVNTVINIRTLRS